MRLSILCLGLAISSASSSWANSSPVKSTGACTIHTVGLRRCSKIKADNCAGERRLQIRDGLFVEARPVMRGCSLSVDHLSGMTREPNAKSAQGC